MYQYDDEVSSDEAEGQDGSAADDEDDAEPKTAMPDDDDLVPGGGSPSLDATPTTPTPPSVPSTPSGRSFLPSIPKIRIRRSAQAAQPPTSASSSAASTPQSQSSVPTATGGKKKRLPGPWSGQKSESYELDAENDIAGIVMLEIHGATDLPRWRNSEVFLPSDTALALIALQVIRTGWDMDPFVVVSFGKKVFRTRVIRHCLNPVWDEKLLFHVRDYEGSFSVQLTVLDWDKLSANDYVGDAAIEVADLAANVPKKDPNTGLYPEQDDDTSFQQFCLPLTTTKEAAWDLKKPPKITFR